MKKAVCEPWDNGYVLASSSRELLERLARGPLTDDQVLRSCILENELVDLVDPATSREMQTGMLWMLIRVIVTLGRRPPPEKTVRKVEKLVEHARADLNWNTGTFEPERACRAPISISYGALFFARLDKSIRERKPLGADKSRQQSP